MLRASRGHIPIALTSACFRGYLGSRLKWEGFSFPTPQLFPQRVFHWKKSILFVCFYMTELEAAPTLSELRHWDSSRTQWFFLMNLRQQVFGEPFKWIQLLKLCRCTCTGCQIWERERNNILSSLVFSFLCDPCNQLKLHNIFHEFPWTFSVNSRVKIYSCLP